MSIMGAINDCPPKPGSTVMTKTMSRSSKNGSTASTGVLGFRATAGFAPPARIARIVSCTLLSASK